MVKIKRPIRKRISSAAQEAPWKGAAVSVAGTAHLRRGIGCSDSSAFFQIGGEISVLVVADGAGSAENSAAASTWAVEAVSEYLTANISPTYILSTDWQKVLGDSVIATRRALEEKSANNGWTLRSCSTTLAVVVATADMVAAVSVGDSIIVIRDSDQTWSTLSLPENGEYVNEAYFVTSRDYISHIRYSHFTGQVSAIAAFSDGLNVITLTNADEVRTTFIEPVYLFAMQAATPNECQSAFVALLRSEKICERTDDDKTLVLAWRR